MQLPTNDRVTSLLTTYLDVQSRRSEVIAGNLANADTADYKARELDFDAFLDDAAAGRPLEYGHEPKLVLQDRAPGIDGNNVDAGHEMAQLADAGMQYLSGVQMIQARLRTLKTAIREGR